MLIIDIILLTLVAIAIISLYKGYKLSDLISPKKWKAVYIWLLKKHLNWLGATDKYITKEEAIQYAYRVSSCSECVNSEDGKCIYCKCDVEGKLNDRMNGDDYGGWGPMKTDDEMKEFLKEYDIIFKTPIVKKKNKKNEK